MTPEQNQRIRELPFLIDNEKDPDKLKELAAELESLLAAQLDEWKARTNRLDDQS